MTNIIQVNNINDYYKAACYDALHIQDEQKHYVFNYLNLNLNTILKITTLANKNNNKVEIINDKFTISSNPYKEGNSIYDAQRLLDLGHLQSCVQIRKKICCNIKDYISVRDKCVNLYRNYTNVIVNVETNLKNRNVYKDIITDLVSAITEKVHAFNVKLVLFPINDQLYYFYKEPIVSFEYVKSSTNSKVGLQITSMNKQTFKQTKTFFNI